MRNHKQLVCVIFMGLFVLGVTVVPGPNSRTQVATSQTQQQIDASRFPIVDCASPTPTDPKERAKREAKSKKYNNRHALPITESTDSIFHIMEWDLGLPALPVAKSSAVIIGEITDARAYLSEDKTDIYSEFAVRIEVILKNDSRTAFSPGGSVIVERDGGRLRFPSGKVVLSATNHQSMPRIGGRYVLFLTPSFPIGGEYEHDFYLITGYEFRAGIVFPLDDPGPGHPITAYKGTSEASFLNDLSSAIANPSPTLEAK